MIHNILFSPGFGNIPEYFYLIEMLKGIHGQVMRGWGSEPKPQRSTQKLHCKDRSYVAIMAVPNRFPAVTIKKISSQVRCNFCQFLVCNVLLWYNFQFFPLLEVHCIKFLKSLIFYIQMMYWLGNKCMNVKTNQWNKRIIGMNQANITINGKQWNHGHSNLTSINS